MKRILVAVPLLAAAGVGGYLLYWVAKSPATAPPSAVKVDLTPERVDRGRYVVTLADCFGCHAERDFSRFNGPIVPGGLGVGGPLPLEGLPGDVVVPNITPDPETGIGAWTDGEIIRAIREGIGRDGRTLFPFMPYVGYRYMSDEDVQAAVAYLRSIPPVKKKQAVTRINFPVNLFMKEAPQPAGSVPAPNRSDPLAYGKYLGTVGGCIDCHTQEEKGKLVAGKEYAGGRLLAIIGTPFRVYSANITPDNDTGIGVWTEERFLQKIRSYKPYVESESPKVGPESFTIMPWLNLCLLTDNDLKAMYAYLRTLRPVYNSVEKYKGFGAESRN